MSAPPSALGMPIQVNLSRFGPLRDEDVSTLIALCDPMVVLEPGQHLLDQGDDQERAFLLRSGWVSRHRILEDGRRHTITLFIAGDFVPVRTDRGGSSLYGLSALATTEAVPISLKRLRALDNERYAPLKSVFDKAQLELETLMAEALVSVAKRTAKQALAHFLVETYTRLHRVGQASDGVLILPLTQEQIGECLALTSVHVSRILSELRKAGLVTPKDDGMVLNLADLAALSDFEDGHLYASDNDVEALAVSRSVDPAMLDPKPRR